MTADELLTVVWAMGPISVHKMRLTGGWRRLRCDIARFIEGLVGFLALMMWRSPPMVLFSPHRGLARFARRD
ncbi:MAG: hypothetical protein C7B45_16440 [Sulfobacillus acidophilus]|uniref:Uncharacterized protein n=1 Tax=Sulfobacillus acidophilus TaxID=53633 RepID=A0A2T2WD04_9FIRM|nr:MAG: hypothetical protein C7B45_16440 [Sulfobacillus acidophilus]